MYKKTLKLLIEFTYYALEKIIISIYYSKKITKNVMFLKCFTATATRS